jgi:hypothetical protein
MAGITALRGRSTASRCGGALSSDCTTEVERMPPASWFATATIVP